MSNWKDDRGLTKYPSIFIPFNECDGLETTGFTRQVPCRIGYTTLTTASGNTDRVVDPVTKRISFTGSVVADRFSFGNSAPAGGIFTSKHDLIMSPIYNIGKHIVISCKVKINPAPSTYNPVFFFNGYAGAIHPGGFTLEFQRSSVDTSNRFRIGYRYSGSTTTAYDNSITNIWMPDEWCDVILILNASNRTTLNVKVFVCDANGVLKNSGSPVATLTKTGGDVFGLTFDGTSTALCYQGGYPVELKDFTAYVDPSDPTANGNLNSLIAWRSNSSNDGNFPDFLRVADEDKILQPFKDVKHYAGNYTLNGTAGKTINDQYTYWNSWGMHNSVMTGMLMSMGIAGFQPTAGTYNTTDLSNFADWMHEKGAKLRIMVNDQTYLDPDSIPAHFPFWTLNNTGGTNFKKGLIWDNIESVEVDDWIATPSLLDTYDSSKATNGTYRWFHHVYWLLKTLVNKPAFSGVVLAETSGDALISTDININGVSNSAGIYGITDASGNHLLAKSYSMRKQTLYYEKMMQFITTYLNSMSRTDVDKSLQINYLRGSVRGNINTVTTTGAPSAATFNKANTLRVGTIMYLLNGSYDAVTAGMALNTPYYVVNPTGSTFQLSATPAGVPISLSINLTTLSSIFLVQPDTHIEADLEGVDVPLIINGYTITRELKYWRQIAQSMKSYDFGTSGPDIITSALENTYFSEISRSVVDMRLDITTGNGLFRDIGPVASNIEIQSQDSTFTGPYVGNTHNQLIKYGNSFPYSTYKYSQVIGYALDRLKCTTIDYFTSQNYTIKTLPDLYIELKNRHSIKKQSRLPATVRTLPTVQLIRQTTIFWDRPWDMRWY